MDSPTFVSFAVFAVILCAAATVVFAAESRPQPLRPPADADAQATLRKAIEEQKRAPAMVFGIVDATGARVFALGNRRDAESAPVDGDTLFEIGSITKVFTGLVLQDMVDRGEVKLDDPIGKFLPATVKTPNQNGRQITLLDLATHTSGLPRLPSNLAPKDRNNPYADYTVDQLYAFLSSYTPDRPIGSKSEYSNLGAGLLGHVLALRAGTNYEALVMERICGPLRLDSTRITLGPALRNRLAAGHNKLGYPAANWDLPTLAGAGALRSTANDLLKFLSANIGLTASSLSNAMAQSHLPHRDAGALGKIGISWYIDTVQGVIWHNGGTGGYRSYAGFSPELRRGILVLANAANDVDDIGQYLLGAHDDIEDFTPVKTHRAVALDTKVLDQYTGQYRFRSGHVLTVTRNGSRFFAQLTGQQPIEFFPETEADFFCQAVDAQLTFHEDDTGAVTHVILHQNGFDQKADRLK